MTADEMNNENEDGDGRLEPELTYAWSWFQYHAQQRLTAFNFFLIIVGVVAVAYAQAIDNDWEVVGAVVGALGALIALGFLMLDVRNEELVDSGRVALQQLEERLGVRPSHDAGERTHLEQTGWIGAYASKSARRHPWISHSRWLRLIEGTVSLVFVAGSVWAATGFCGA